MVFSFIRVLLYKDFEKLAIILIIRLNIAVTAGLLNYSKKALRGEVNTARWL